MSVALVTGASRGIGRAVALRLAEDGYDIAFTYASRHDAAEAVRAEVEERGRKAVCAAVPVADVDQMRAFADDVQASLGEVDVVVCSAGITRDRPLAMMSQQEWAEVIDVNLTGTFATCRALAFDFMKRRRGTVVLMSSVAGVHGNATQVNYSASKAGIIGAGKAMAKELASRGVRVNVVAPGFIETDMTDALTDKVRDLARARIPVGRFGTADDVAEAVSFLASPRSGYITGQVLGVDGGLVL